MTIYEIKHRTKETSPYFFTRETLRFFNQTMKNFKVSKIRGENKWLIIAPYQGFGKVLYTERIFNGDTNKLERVTK